MIRTLNESELIVRCLETVQAQRGGFDLDVLVVDSGSTDSTVELASAQGARVIELAATAFDYSKSLNLGIEHVSGDIVLSLSAHAIPVDDRWLERMVAPFDDARVAGVSGRQLPWPGAHWKETRRLRVLFPVVGRVHSLNVGDELVFSNAASAIRRSVWLEQPFRLPAVEDLDWARRAIEAGWSIVYEAEAAVYHSHEESPRAQARRLIDIERANNTGGHQRRWRVLRDALGLVYRDARAIIGLDEPLRRKSRFLFELGCTAYYYVVDFSRSGTTAERRVNDSLYVSR